MLEFLTGRGYSFPDIRRAQVTGGFSSRGVRYYYLVSFPLLDCLLWARSHNVDTGTLLNSEKAA
jgi:hypothetical protein